MSKSVEVPNLNASELNGNTSSAFLPATGTAANSNELGGIPTNGYMQGGGDATGTRLALTGQHNSILLTSPGANLIAFCDITVTGSGASLLIFNNGGTASGASAFLVDKDGVGATLQLGTPQYITPGDGSTSDYVVIVEVDNVTNVSTFTATERYDSGSDTCNFTAQVVTTNG